MAAHSSVLAWEIPWTEEPGGLQSVGSQRVGHSLGTEHACTHVYKVCWIPVGFFLIVGYASSLLSGDRLFLAACTWLLFMQKFQKESGESQHLGY